jgi:hypothetical protein
MTAREPLSTEEGRKGLERGWYVEEVPRQYRGWSTTMEAKDHAIHRTGGMIQSRFG